LARANGRRYRVFCASLADVFEDAPGLDAIRADLWGLILETSCLDWLLLTKRPENVMKMLPWPWYGAAAGGCPDNVWIGATAENQEQADARIPILLNIPAALRFVSVEPQIGPGVLGCDSPELGWVRYLNSPVVNGETMPGIDWVIAGGESGPDARPMHPNWARALRDQCVAAGVPFFFKQWGAWWPLHGTGEPTGDEAADPRPFRWVTLDGTVQTSGCAPDALVVKTRKEHVTPLLDGALWRQMPEALRLEGERHD